MKGYIVRYAVTYGKTPCDDGDSRSRGREGDDVHTGNVDECLRVAV